MSRRTITYPPTRGPRFVANVRTGEVHDRTRACVSCRLSKIHEAREARTLDELRLHLGEGLKLHKDCFPERSLTSESVG